MYSITTRLHGPFAAFHLISETELRLACVQFDALATTSPEMVSSLLSEASAEAQNAEATLQWPAAMAEVLSDALAVRFASGAVAPTLLFAAVLATEDRILVCTAGDLRVHLIVDDRITEITRDHVMQSDTPALEVPALAATVPTRWLGGTGQGPPESHAWDARVPYAIAVCSSQLHRHRPRPRHKNEVLAHLELQGSQEGLAVWIDRRRPG